MNQKFTHHLIASTLFILGGCSAGNVPPTGGTVPTLPAASVRPTPSVTTSPSSPTTVPTATPTPGTATSLPQQIPTATLGIAKTLTVKLNGTKLSAAMLTALQKETISVKLLAKSSSVPIATLTTQYGQDVIFKDVPVGIPLAINAEVRLSTLPQPADNCNNVVFSAGAYQEFTLDKSEPQPLELLLTDTSISQDLSCIEKTTFRGNVLDDAGTPLEGLKVTAKSLNTAVNFSAETTTTKDGTYSFNNAPTGVQIEIVAAKPGFTTRKRIEVLKSSKVGDPDSNSYNFGANGDLNTALSDKPEVTALTPTLNANGVDPKPTITLKFNEPMTRQSVEDTFTLRSFNSPKLTVDAGAAGPTFNGDSQLKTINNDLIFDASAFTVSWNSDDTEATFILKEEFRLPTDKDTLKTPRYQVVFNHPTKGRAIKDKAGTARSTTHFKLTGLAFDESSQFAVKTDETKPEITTLEAQTNEGQGPNGDALKVTFSEPMMLTNQSRTIAGGMEDRSTVPGAEAKAPAGYANVLNATERQAARNYTITVTRNNAQTYQGTLLSLGGTATYTDAKTVLLALPKNKSGQDVTTVNMGTVLSAAGSFATDNTANGAGVGEYTLSLVAGDGSLVALPAVVKPADSLGDNLSLAADLQSKLNAQAAALADKAPSANPFTVTASSATNGTVSITFRDSSGKYIGWKQVTLAAGNGTDSLPSFGTTGVTYGKDSFLELFAPGDVVKVQVASTILDPAGNNMNADKSAATVTVK